MTGKTLGIVLLAAAVITTLLIGLVMFVPVAEGSRSGGAATLGFALFVLFIALPLGGAGVFFLLRGGQEAVQQTRIEKERKLLNIVKARGQTTIGDVVFELDSTRDNVQNMLYDLVGKGLYSGYINWDEGTLYSEQASALRELTNCRNCGGELDLAGKGVIRCPYCGTEYFL